MKSSSFGHTDIPVLISGAGPAGLFAAILLTKLKIPCRLIERNLEVSPLSKALTIHARTLEIFAFSGILEKFLERGKHLSNIHLYKGSKPAVVLPALKTVESHFGFGLFLEQLRTTAIMTEELEAMGVEVDRGWELMDTKVIEDTAADGKTWVETTIRRARVGTNVRQTESKVLGVVEADPEEEGKKYETQVVRSEYLIATDGGKSTVRHILNIGFPGRTLDRSMIIFDGHVESDLPSDNITIVDGVNDHNMATFPLHDGQIRILLDDGHLSSEEYAALCPEDLTVEKFEKLAAACVAPAKFKCLDCSWLTYYRVNERQAENFAYKNRIFLGGDASHVHSPAGGQGMNTALQDVFNLTWKMALVLQRIAPETILKTYEVERKPVADAIIKLSARTLDIGVSQDFLQRTFRNIAFTIAPYILPYIPAGATNPMTMLKIKYHENDINRHSKSQACVGEEYQVGHRARDGNLCVIQRYDTKSVEGESDTVRLHELLVGPGIFHVLVFVSDMLVTSTSGTSGQSATTIDGVETTTPDALSKEIDTHLKSWRSKWAYKSLLNTSKPVATAEAGHTASSSTASRAAIPHPSSAATLFMVHVIASDGSTVPGSEHNDSQLSVFGESTDTLVAKPAGEGKIYSDHCGVVHQKYGVQEKHGPGAIIVVRPDSYYGYRVLGANHESWSDVDGYFKTILVD
ncbi:hypothetical protein BGZ98_008841 [Dissophora globulifera]|nr:hypothetical protein BGZ98_008841 [Dissophora globulifera]